MKGNAFWLYVFLGIGAVLWGVCLYQVLFMPAAIDTDVYVSTTVTYPSSYKGNSSFPTCSVPRSGLSHPSVAIPAPKVTMQSVSQQGSSATWYMPTTSSQKVQSIGGGSAPAGSTASGNNSARGIAYTNIVIPMPAVQGFVTSASEVRGGTTSSETYARMNQREHVHTTTSASASRRGALPPGVCEECHWVQGADGHWYCSMCGADALDGCECSEEHGYCWCPIGDGWQVWVFMALLCVGYGTLRVRKKEAII